MRKKVLVGMMLAVAMMFGSGFSYAQSLTAGYSQGNVYCPWQNQAAGRQQAAQNAAVSSGYRANRAYHQGRMGGMGYGMNHGGWHMRSGSTARSYNHNGRW